MNILDEKRTFTTIRLTENQKKVLTRIISAATEKLAADEISKGRNLIAARDLLVKLGLIEFRDGYAAITPDGEQIMKDSNLTDETGQLTDEGNKFAYDEENQPAEESLIKQANKALRLNEGKIKELAQAGEELLDNIINSEDGQRISAAINDGDEKVVMGILERRSNDENVIAAAMVKAFGGNLQDYL